MSGPASRVSTREYAAVRVASHRAQLLRTAQYESLLAAPSIDALLGVLDGTVYRRALERENYRYAGTQLVDAATGTHVADEYRFVVEFFERKQLMSIDLLAAIADRRDMKTVLRGKYAGAAPAEIIASLAGPGITVPRPALELLAAAPSLEEAVRVASSISMSYAEALREGAETFAITDSFIAFENAIDADFFTTAYERLVHSGREGAQGFAYLQAVIDEINVMTLARAIFGGSPLHEKEFTERYRIIGGRLFKDEMSFIKASRCASISELGAHLGRTLAGRVIRAEEGEYELSSSLSSLERALHREVIKPFVQQGKRAPLAEDRGFSYLLALENEAINIRVIARGADFGIPADMRRREMTIIS